MPKDYIVTPEAIAAGLARLDEPVLPLSAFTPNTSTINFASYNLCGFYFSSINHCKHFLSEDLAKIIAALSASTDMSKLALDPLILGSLYSFHLKDYAPYLISWLIAERVFQTPELVKSIEDFHSLVAQVCEEYKEYKDKLILFLQSHKNDPRHEKNAPLIDVLVSSLQKPITIEDIKKSEVLKFAFNKKDVASLHEDIQFGKSKRNTLERWQIWYKRQNAVFALIEHAIKKMGINIFNFQEGSAEAVMQLTDYLNKNQLNYKIVCFSDQNGQSLNGLTPLREEGFKAQDGLGMANAIMFDKARYDELEVKQFWISETPDAPSCTPGGIAHQKNSLTAVVLHDKLHNKQFAVFNTHITPSSDGHEFSRKKIIELITKFVDERGKIPFMISGDFNTYPDIKSESEHYLGYKDGLNVEDMRDLFAGKLCAHKMIAPSTFLGYGFDGTCNILHEKSGEHRLRPQVLDHEFFNGFEACGHAAKIAAPVDVSSGECQLDLEAELDSPRMKAALEKHQTASDHQMLVAQVMHKIGIFANVQSTPSRDPAQINATFQLGAK